ncbi:carboxymuconolactone decarboxylase family protein [Neoroseomonas soli]|uniref:4-carboxymuconolactone decarboxylase n=1 Tax=Neoroseomonas soli TaxID=1081025 RepID=A0A9X9WT01_9PROT|nr:carboxymuconolactone decarboxylase family protein [Neoroseomonas soli]MBR0670280.1 4-carboxymuconolactone decarboxylase [Neoroseomonas soli]
MPKSELWQRGDAMRRRLMGAATVERMAKGVYDDPLMEKFGDYAREAVFAMLWDRPGLDLKTRTLICVVSDTATHAWPELAIHLRMARRAGWTEDELSEALLHLSGYIGLPAVREAMITARTVFTEMRGEPDGGLGM